MSWRRFCILPHRVARVFFSFSKPLLSDSYFFTSPRRTDNSPSLRLTKSSYPVDVDDKSEICWRMVRFSSKRSFTCCFETCNSFAVFANLTSRSWSDFSNLVSRSCIFLSFRPRWLLSSFISWPRLCTSLFLSLWMLSTSLSLLARSRICPCNSFFSVSSRPIICAACSSCDCRIPSSSSVFFFATIISSSWSSRLSWSAIAPASLSLSSISRIWRRLKISSLSKARARSLSNVFLIRCASASARRRSSSNLCFSARSCCSRASSFWIFSSRFFTSPAVRVAPSSGFIRTKSLHHGDDFRSR